MSEYAIWAVFLTHLECERLASMLLLKGWGVRKTGSKLSLWEGRETHLGYTLAITVQTPNLGDLEARQVHDAVGDLCKEVQLNFLMMLIIKNVAPGSCWQGSQVVMPLQEESKTSWERLDTNLV